LARGSDQVVADGDDSVRVGSLADHIGGRVPAITQEMFGQYQSPIRRLSGNDFPLGIRQSLLKADDTVPKTPWAHGPLIPPMARAAQ
jgi:hypothetical protein